MKKTLAMLFGLMLLSVPFVSAYVEEIGVVAGPGNEEPTIQLLEKKVFSYLNGPEVNRQGSYLFTGEVVQDKVKVCDSNGVDDIKWVEVWVDTTKKAFCDKYGTPTATCQNYKCQFTVGTEHGEKKIIVKAIDNSDAVGELQAQTFFFNPAINLGITTTNDPSHLNFPEGAPGTTVEAENGLNVKNTGEDGIEVKVWMAGSDLYGSSVAMCPTSNVLAIDNVDYNTVGGTVTWTQVPRYDINKVHGNGDYLGKISKNQHIQVNYRLNYPVPCIGSFSGGKIYFVADAI